MGLTIALYVPAHCQSCACTGLPRRQWVGSCSVCSYAAAHSQLLCLISHAGAPLQGLRIELAGEAAVNWLEGVQAEALLRSPLAAPGPVAVLPIAQVVEADLQVEMRCFKAFAAVRVSGDLPQGQAALLGVPCDRH